MGHMVGRHTRARMGSVSSDNFLFMTKSPVRFSRVTDSGDAMAAEQSSGLGVQRM